MDDRDIITGYIQYWERERERDREREKEDRFESNRNVNNDFNYKVRTSGDMDGEDIVTHQRFFTQRVKWYYSTLRKL